jgi:hypothetical protein
MPLNYMNAKKRGLVKLAGGGPVDSGGAVEHLASIQDELASEKPSQKKIDFSKDALKRASKADIAKARKILNSTGMYDMDKGNR